MLPEPDDTMNIDDDFQFVINEVNYRILFESMKYKKSKKFVNYLMMKVVNFGRDYKNPKRLKLLSQLRTMKKPYRDLFGEDFV